MNERLDQRLYVLDFLSRPVPPEERGATCSYRLICSGALRGPNDMSHGSTSPRVLLTDPFELLVASENWRDIDSSYPQELGLTFRVPFKRPDGFDGWWPPSDELAHDLSALLSLIARRLVTVAGCVKLTPEDEKGSTAVTILEFPFPLATVLKKKYWPEQSPTMVVWPHKPPTDFKSYMPPVLEFNRDFAGLLLKTLPSLRAKREIVLAARLYALAMSLVHEDTDIAYFLMTMALECLANKTVDAESTKAIGETDYPSEYSQVAERLKLTPEQTRELFVAANPPEPKARYKFLKFIEDNCTEAMWQPDNLFQLEGLDRIFPTKDQLRKAADEVYKQRSGFAHRGVPYSPSISIGLRSMSHYSTTNELLNPKGCFPPFPWFERLTNVCILSYWFAEAEALKT